MSHSLHNSSTQSLPISAPKDFLDAWLSYLKIAPAQQYKDILTSEAFDDFHSLIELEEADLQEFGFKRGHQKKIIRWTQEMRDEEKRRHFLTKIGFEPLLEEELERTGASQQNISANVSHVVEGSFSSVYTLLAERLTTITSHHESHMERAFIEFIHNAVFLLSTHQAQLFVETCFHPVDIASLKYLEINLHDLATKLLNGETNYSLQDFDQLFKGSIDDEDAHLKLIQQISNTELSRDRYGGDFEYKSEKGEFLCRYLRLQPEHDGRWYLCNFPPQI